MTDKELIETLLRQHEGDMEMIRALTRAVNELQAQLEALQQAYERLEKEKKVEAENLLRTIEELRDTINTLQDMLFGKHSEKGAGREENSRKDKENEGGKEDRDNKGKGDDGDNTPSPGPEPFDGPDDESNPQAQASEPRKTPKKRGGHRQWRDYSGIETEDYILNPGDDKLKDARFVGYDDSYRFYYVGPRLIRVRIRRGKFLKKDGKIIEEKLPWVPEELEKRRCDASLIAGILHNKYYNHIPLERQLRELNSGPIKLAKTTFLNYCQAGIDALDGLYQAIRRKVLQDHYVHMDETVQYVIDHERGKRVVAYDWGMIAHNYRLCYFFSKDEGSRSHDVLDEEAQNLIATWLACDDYAAYKKVGKRLGLNIRIVPCIQHIRRYFYRSLKYHKKLAGEALRMLDRLFLLDALMKKKKLTSHEKKVHRKRYFTMLIDKFKEWLMEQMEKPGFNTKSNIGKAINHAWGCIDQMYELCRSGVLELTNNMAERCMRSHAMGRHAYLFCENFDSVDRTCKIYSIIESCKLCHIDTFKYLKAVLTREPKFGETWDDLLPCNDKMWADIRIR